MGKKLRLQGRRTRGASAEGRWGAAGRGARGDAGSPAPRARSRAPLTFAGAARTHFRGLRRGARGRAGDLPRVPREERGSPALGRGPARAPGREAPAEEPRGRRGAESGVPAWALAGDRAASRRRRRSRSQWEEKVVSFPSVSPLLRPLGSGPALPLPRPLPLAGGRVGAGKTRNLSCGSARRLPPRQVGSGSRPPARLPALPTVPGAPNVPARSAVPPAWVPWPFPAGMSPD